MDFFYLDPVERHSLVFYLHLIELLELFQVRPLKYQIG